jgi:hypothetical protein
LLSGLADGDQLRALEREPIVVGAGWSEFRGQVPVRAGLPDAQRRAAIAAMTLESLSWAGEHGAGLLYYLYLPIEDALDVARAHADDAPVVVLQDGFEDYLAWLPRNRRAPVRRELRDFLESGRRIHECVLAEVVDVIAMRCPRFSGQGIQ